MHATVPAKVMVANDATVEKVAIQGRVFVPSGEEIPGETYNPSRWVSQSGTSPIGRERNCDDVNNDRFDKLVDQIGVSERDITDLYARVIRLEKNAFGGEHVQPDSNEEPRSLPVTGFDDVRHRLEAICARLSRLERRADHPDKGAGI